MHLDDYYQNQNEKISFTRQQASDFAKAIAGDFNPIHDTDAKRFCVPGDLLFAVLLKHFGISQKMTFTFSGMVSDGVNLHFQIQDEKHIHLVDDKNKTYIWVQREGELCQKNAVIEALTGCYVKFSGRTFPHILVPLMQGQGMMINPERPLVIYENMFINLRQCNTAAVKLELDTVNTRLEVNGKRGNATLAFSLLDDAGEVVGTGEKHIVLSGLQPYEQDKIDLMVKLFEQRRAGY